MQLTGRLDELRLLLKAPPVPIDQFERIVVAIYELHDPTCIRPILELIDDRDRWLDQSGLAVSLLESLEHYSAREYVPQFLAALPVFSVRSPELCRGELRKLLWAPEHRQELERASGGLDLERARVLRILLEGLRTPGLRAAQEALLHILG